MHKKCIQFTYLKKIQNFVYIFITIEEIVTYFLFVTGTEIIKFKAKDSEILAYSLCLGNISKYWSQENMKKTGFNGYIYDFSTDYNAIAVSDILNIHKYLMKKNGIV